MITSQTNAEKYSALFKEAWDVLEAQGKLDADDKEEFKDQDTFEYLEQYFTQIGDIAELHANKVEEVKGGGDATVFNEGFKTYSKFLMLPLDEEYFNINANSRTISVPSVYQRNGVSVEGDQIAETLLFEIDRYFDYTDLTKTTIYVQWINPAGEEGASWITMVDFDDKKIRFGWPLSNKITVAGNGKLQFSVRFFMKKDDKLVYSLNTLPANVTIKNALLIDIDDDIIPDEPSDLFKQAILNGSYSGAKIEPAAIAPVDGYTFPSPVYLDDYDGDGQVVYSRCIKYDGTGDGSTVFYAQGYANDAGTVSYKWEYQPIGGSYSEIKEITNPTITYILTEDTERNANKRYYTFNGTNYNLDDKTSFAEGTEYYERVSQYSIPVSETNVTGAYRVTLKNKVGVNAKETSLGFVIPAPEAVNITTDLNENGNILDNNEKILNIEHENKNHELYSYSWFFKNSLTDEFDSEPILDANTMSYTATEPGWYQVNITNTLNRNSQTTMSKVARVTNLPESVTITSGADGDPYIYVYANENNLVTLSVTTEIPGVGHLKLRSDYLSYEWYMIGADDMNKTDDIPLSVDNEYDIILDTATGTLIADLNKIPARSVFYCKVYNHLNDRTSSPVITAEYIIRPYSA